MTSEIRNKTYHSVYDEIDALDISVKEKMTAIILSFIVSLAIGIGPIAVCINCLIFNNFMRLFSFGIALFVFLICFLTDFLYLHTITKKRVSGLYHIWAIDGAIIFLACIAIFSIITLIGVI